MIIHGYALLRASLKELLQQENDLAVALEVDGTLESLDTMKGLHTAVIIVDNLLRESNDRSLICILNTLDPDVPILAMSVHDELNFIKNAFQDGAKGFILQDDVAQEIIIAVRTLLSGEYYLGHELKLTLADKVVRGILSGDMSDKTWIV